MLNHGGKLRAAAAHYGIDLAEWLDLSTGINPNGWPVAEIPTTYWNRLPENKDGLEAAASHYYGARNHLAIAGSQAAIQALPSCLKLVGNTVGVVSPGYEEHVHAWRQADFQIKLFSPEQLDLLSQDDLLGLSALVVINPNNPTGYSYTRDRLLQLHQWLQLNGGVLIIDEAFMDSSPQHSLLAESYREGLIILRSLGKFFGLAGARVGFVFAEEVLLQRLNTVLGPWAVASPARYVAAKALADFSWQEKNRQQLQQSSARLKAILCNYGFEPNGGTALFQWVVINDAKKLHEALAELGIYTRLFDQPIKSLRFGLPPNQQAFQRLDKALSEITGVEQESKKAKKPQKFASKTLMVQGTTSDAGKTILVAGLCRVLYRRGIKVVPFKPQNMALNSSVSVDGGEIGRAQALQAEACGLAPHSHMNPVLLKPNSDTGAQVIIHGKAVGNMRAKDYQDYKKQARLAVLESHAVLQQNYQFILVEGAGSPAEINLRRSDIANMGFAEAVDCPVILVADIDRGGVFAHLVGTLELLSPSERARVKGFVINRFRGDIKLLQPGLDWLQQKTGKPVLGVLPYLHDLHLDAEDALDKRQILPDAQQPYLHVVVPILPRISNHNDLDPLQQHPQVNVEFVAIDQVPPACDLVILPGSKSVRADIEKLQLYGWADYLNKHLRYGGKVIGICGGFQMLGQIIDDPHGIEGPSGSCNGFALLDMQTQLQTDKILRQVTGRLLHSNASVIGYEIHAGNSTGKALDNPVVMLEKNRTDGAYSSDGQVMGTYLHGLFESSQACEALLAWAGLEHQVTVSNHADTRSKALDLLADAIEKHLDTDSILGLLGKENGQ